jgi:hypothetical protein
VLCCGSAVMPPSQPLSSLASLSFHRKVVNRLNHYSFTTQLSIRSTLTQATAMPLYMLTDVVASIEVCVVEARDESHALERAASMFLNEDTTHIRAVEHQGPVHLALFLEAYFKVNKERTAKH